VEFNQVVGSRRTIRFFEPDIDVEQAKLQEMLEAGNRSSRGVNADFLKTITVRRRDVPDDVREALKTPTTTAALDLAPVWIFMWGDPGYPDGAEDRLGELVDAGALPATHGWSHAYIDEVIKDGVIGAFAGDPLLNTWFISVECGLSINQILLSGVNQGLGVGLHAFNAAVAREYLDVPQAWLPMWVLLVGYPAEDPAAGGQRPRRPLGHNNFLGRYGEPYPEDEGVTGHLQATGMIQDTGSRAERAAELTRLTRRLRLPEG